MRVDGAHAANTSNACGSIRVFRARPPFTAPPCLHAIFKLAFVFTITHDPRYFFEDVCRTGFMQFNVDPFFNGIIIRGGEVHRADHINNRQNCSSRLAAIERNGQIQWEQQVCDTCMYVTTVVFALVFYLANVTIRPCHCRARARITLAT